MGQVKTFAIKLTDRFFKIRHKHPPLCKIDNDEWDRIFQAICSHQDPEQYNGELTAKELTYLWDVWAK